MSSPGFLSRVPYGCFPPPDLCGWWYLARVWVEGRRRRRPPQWSWVPRRVNRRCSTTVYSSTLLEPHWFFWFPSLCLPTPPPPPSPFPRIFVVAPRSLTLLNPDFLSASWMTPVPVRVFPPPSLFPGHRLRGHSALIGKLSVLGGPCVNLRHGRRPRYQVTALVTRGTGLVIVTEHIQNWNWIHLKYLAFISAFMLNDTMSFYFDLYLCVVVRKKWNGYM